MYYYTLLLLLYTGIASSQRSAAQSGRPSSSVAVVPHSNSTTSHPTGTNSSHTNATSNITVSAGPTWSCFFTLDTMLYNETGFNFCATPGSCSNDIPLVRIDRVRSSTLNPGATCFLYSEPGCNGLVSAPFVFPGSSDVDSIRFERLARSWRCWQHCGVREPQPPHIPPVPVVHNDTTLRPSASGAPHAGTTARIQTPTGVVGTHRTSQSSDLYASVARQTQGAPSLLPAASYTTGVGDNSLEASPSSRTVAVVVPLPTSADRSTSSSAHSTVAVLGVTIVETLPRGATATFTLDHGSS